MADGLDAICIINQPCLTVQSQQGLRHVLRFEFFKAKLSIRISTFSTMVRQLSLDFVVMTKTQRDIAPILYQCNLKLHVCINVFFNFL